mgnify:CR=1 FL=1
MVESQQELLTDYERDLRLKLLHIKKLKGALQDIADKGKTKLDLRPIQPLFEDDEDSDSDDSDISESEPHEQDPRLRSGEGRQVEQEIKHGDTSSSADSDEDSHVGGVPNDEMDDHVSDSRVQRNKSPTNDTTNAAFAPSDRSPEHATSPSRRPEPIQTAALARARDDMSVPSPKTPIESDIQSDAGSRGHIGRLIAQKALRSTAPSPRNRRSPRFQQPGSPVISGAGAGHGEGHGANDGQARSGTIHDHCWHGHRFNVLEYCKLYLLTDVCIAVGVDESNQSSASRGASHEGEQKADARFGFEDFLSMVSRF